MSIQKLNNKTNICHYSLLRRDFVQYVEPKRFTMKERRSNDQYVRIVLQIRSSLFTLENVLMLLRGRRIQNEFLIYVTKISLITKNEC